MVFPGYILSRNSLQSAHPARTPRDPVMDHRPGKDPCSILSPLHTTALPSSSSGYLSKQ